MTNQEINKAIESAKGSFAMKGLKIPQEVENLGRKYLKREITEEEYQKAVLKFHNQ